MIITYIGHSCFKVEEGNKSIVLDPYKAGSVPGYGDVNISAVQVSCSHGHGDHAGEECVEKVEGPLFDIENIHTYHDPMKGVLRGKNNITIVKGETATVVHMGDIGCKLKADQADKLKGCDVLLIPVGGFFTINAKEAMDMIEQISPKIVIPMHYRGESTGYDVIAKISDFTDLCEKAGKNIKYLDSVLDTADGILDEIVVLKPLRAE